MRVRARRHSQRWFGDFGFAEAHLDGSTTCSILILREGDKIRTDSPKASFTHPGV